MGVSGYPLPIIALKVCTSLLTNEARLLTNEARLSLLQTMVRSVSWRRLICCASCCVRLERYPKSCSAPRFRRRPSDSWPAKDLDALLLLPPWWYKLCLYQQTITYSICSDISLIFVFMNITMFVNLISRPPQGRVDVSVAEEQMQWK